MSRSSTSPTAPRQPRGAAHAPSRCARATASAVATFGLLAGLTGSAAVATTTGTTGIVTAAATASTPTAAYITLVYRDLFGRSPDPAGLSSWSRALSTGTPRMAVANAITYSTEYRSALITASYQRYLARKPDPQGLRSWLDAMASGSTVQEMEAGFISSREYYARAGSTDATWVAQMYRDVLGRPAGAAEIDGWTTALRRGAAHHGVAQGILMSFEHLASVIDQHYRHLLGRGIDPTGRNGWVSAMHSGHRVEDVIGGIIASAEYYARATAVANAPVPTPSPTPKPSPTPTTKPAPTPAPKPTPAPAPAPAPTTTPPSTTAPAPGSSPGAGAAQPATRVIDKTLLPFASTSPWRLGVARTATFAPADDPRNLEIARVDGGGEAWMNRDQYSHPVVAATAADPLVTVTDSYHSLRDVPAGGTWQEHIPATARIAGGTDRHMHVLTPDGQFVQEHFAVKRVSATHYTTKRRHLVSLDGSGIGPQNGTRAYGGSAIGGLIRAWEVDPSHPQYTGSIEHPLAIALRLNQLHFSGVRWKDDGHGGAFNRHGYGLAQGYVWPATEQDGASYNNYSGDIPMGSYFAIPPGVSLDRLGLKTPQARMLAQAAQDYGVYVTDASGTSTFYLEDDNSVATKSFRSALIGPNFDGKDLKRIFKALKVVTSNSRETPNGGPLGVERRGDAPLTTAR